MKIEVVGSPTIAILHTVAVSPDLLTILEKLLALTDKFAAVIDDGQAVKAAVAALDAKLAAHMADHGDPAVLDGQADALRALLQGIAADVSAAAAKLDPAPPSA